MSIQAVNNTDTFEGWRLKTNDAIQGINNVTESSVSFTGNKTFVSNSAQGTGVQVLQVTNSQHTIPQRFYVDSDGNATFAGNVNVMGAQGISVQAITGNLPWSLVTGKPTPTNTVTLTGAVTGTTTTVAATVGGNVSVSVAASIPAGSVGNTSLTNSYFTIQGVQYVLGQSYSGAAGLQGTQGSQGIQGIQGVQGRQGIQGTQGTQGEQGIQGIQGTQGVQGTQGTQGRQGIQGIQGTQGAQGQQGVQGVQGIQGIQGTYANYVLSNGGIPNGSQGINGDVWYTY